MGLTRLTESPEVGRVLIGTEELQARIAELGAAISRDYAGRNPLLVGVLRGVALFMADLMRAIAIPLEVDFMAISRYGPEAEALGVVRVIKDLDRGIEGRHVLFVEDIVDTGLTLGYLLRILRARQPASLAVCTLLDRSVRRLIDIDISYKGFELPDVFLVGYGLDYQQRLRNLPYIAELKPLQRMEG
jgi:hypoxanthine phosphoribosyltransferase